MLLLLRYNASLCIRNGEDRRPSDVAKPGSDIHKLLLAAHAADVRRKEEKLLTAARDNDLQTISTLVSVRIM